MVHFHLRDSTAMDLFAFILAMSAYFSLTKGKRTSVIVVNSNMIRFSALPSERNHFYRSQRGFITIKNNLDEFIRVSLQDRNNLNYYSLNVFKFFILNSMNTLTHIGKSQFTISGHEVRESPETILMSIS